MSLIDRLKWEASPLESGRFYAGMSVVIIASCATAAAQAQPTGADASKLRTSIPELERCRQLLLVSAPDWSSVSAEIRFFERQDVRAPWREVLTLSPAVLGRNGIGWGIGLHGTSAGGEPVKREGDGKAPAGVFPLVEAFGFAAAEDTSCRSFLTGP
jgi:L,D-peptidoglycan transpeptidase YkuD (ErfK/YbiS/YcfS/YnhG family)